MGRIFAKRFTLHDSCLHCGLRYLQNDGDTFGFMYVSTAFFSGIIIAVMWFFRPANLLLGQILVAVAAVVTMFGTLRPRKGLAVAIEYLTRHRNPQWP